MALWSKVKGVFGRLGTGIRKGFDWLRKNKEAISDVGEAIGGFVPDKHRDAYNSAMETGNRFLNRI